MPLFLTARPTWTRTARLITEHAALLKAIGGAPSHWACYRFTAKLRDHGDMLTECIDQVLASLHEAYPEMGQTIAIDGSDMPAFANGHKHIGNKNGPLRERFADPDAGWGHRSSISTRKGGAFYGTSCTPRSAPGRNFRSPGRSGQPTSPSKGKWQACWTAWPRGFTPGVGVLDKGYDGEPMYAECESRASGP